jgi:hypothetical protein
MGIAAFHFSNLILQLQPLKARIVQPNLSKFRSRAVRSISSSKMVSLEVQTFDFIVIGGGSGGSGTARRAAGWYGAKTLLIENSLSKSQRFLRDLIYLGNCLKWAHCCSSKTLPIFCDIRLYSALAKRIMLMLRFKHKGGGTCVNVG